jgi:dihydroorotase
MPLPQVIALLSARPASVLGLRAGTLSVGADADVLLFSPDSEWAFRARESRSLARNTPFDGWALPGKVQLTLRAGTIMYGELPASRQSQTLQR